MALYVTRPRRDEVRIGRGLPSAVYLRTMLMRMLKILKTVIKFEFVL